MGAQAMGLMSRPLQKSTEAKTAPAVDFPFGLVLCGFNPVIKTQGKIHELLPGIGRKFHPPKNKYLFEATSIHLLGSPNFEVQCVPGFLR